jgi:hypothetical protein
MAATSKPKMCQACGEHEPGRGDFVCRFCFGKLPQPIKRKLAFARGRPEEPKKKEEALAWLSRKRTSG